MNRNCLKLIVTVGRDAHTSFLRWDTGSPVQVRDGGSLKMLGAVIGESVCAKYMQIKEPDCPVHYNKRQMCINQSHVGTLAHKNL